MRTSGPGGGGVARVGDLRVAMLHYGVGTSNVYATVIDSGGAVCSIQLASIEQTAPEAERMSGMLRAPTRYPPGELTEALHTFSTGWGRRLLPAAELLAEYDILVIVPHHLLHDLPLQVVRIGDAAECLGNRFGVTYCSSATLFQRAVARNPVRDQDVSRWRFPLEAADAGGAPDPPASCVALGLDLLGGDARYAGLARDCAGRFANATVLHGRDDLKGSVAKAADVICLVCHGVTNAHDPDDSGLLLANNGVSRSELTVQLHLGQTYWFRDLPFSYIPPHVEVAPEFDAYPRMPELMTLTEVRTFVETHAQLVMLLGCSTATGQLRSGDAYNSLAYQWLQAGAVSVLGHQWEADFPFVAGWVPVFLDYWIRRRQPKAVALRDSLNQVLDDGLVPRDALHLWGAVTLLGDWL